MSPGTPTTIVSAVTRASASRTRLRVAHRLAIDRLAQQQERLDREALGEAPAVMIEILGHRRPIETAAAACRSACRARRGRDRSACRAGARGSCRWRRRRCAGRRAPARAAGAASPCPSRRDAGPAEIVIELARSARDGAPRTRRRPCRRGWRRPRSPGSCSRSRRATRRRDRRGRRPRCVVRRRGSSKPRHVDPLPGQRRAEHRVLARDRSGRARTAPATTPRADRRLPTGRRRTETATR